LPSLSVAVKSGAVGFGFGSIIDFCLLISLFG
jgi:hypothetical protein